MYAPCPVPHKRCTSSPQAGQGWSSVSVSERPRRKASIALQGEQLIDKRASRTRPGGLKASRWPSSLLDWGRSWLDQDIDARRTVLWLGTSWIWSTGTCGPRRFVIQDYKIVPNIQIANVEVAGETNCIAMVAIVPCLLGLLLCLSSGSTPLLISNPHTVSAACVENRKRCIRWLCLCKNWMPRHTKTTNSLGVNPSVTLKLARSPPPNLTEPLIPGMVLAFCLHTAASSACCCATHKGTVWGLLALSRCPFERKPLLAYPVRLSSYSSSRQDKSHRCSDHEVHVTLWVSYGNKDNWESKIENGQQQSKAYFMKHWKYDIFLGKECVHSKCRPES